MRKSDAYALIITSIVMVLSVVMGMLVGLGQANAAATWLKQEGVYFQYKIPPKMSIMYVKIPQEVPTEWVKQAGLYSQFKSNAAKPATKYELTGKGDQLNDFLDCLRSAGFYCHAEFGGVYNLGVNTVMQCPHVAVIGEMPFLWDGVQLVNGKFECPKPASK